MKLFASFSVLLSLITALPTVLAVPANSLALPYSNTKVLRIPTGPSEAALKELTDLSARLGLSAWTSVPTVNRTYDVEVPNSKYDEFVAAVNEIMAKNGAKAMGYGIGVMHEDLGASIIAEQEGMYAPVVDPKGTCDNPALSP